jgi:ABC-type uncharacterized transport system involved in gliding motility auxiliary subunit
MSKFLQISGIVGAVLLVFGLIAYFFTENLFDPYVLVHLRLGAILIVAYLVTQGKNFVASFGRRSTNTASARRSTPSSLVAVLVVLNIFSARYNQRWDLTESRVFSLSPQTVKLLQGPQPGPGRLRLLREGREPRASDLMKSYAYASKRVKFTAGRSRPPPRAGQAI